MRFTVRSMSPERYVTFTGVLTRPNVRRLASAIFITGWPSTATRTSPALIPAKSAGEPGATFKMRNEAESVLGIMPIPPASVSGIRPAALTSAVHLS